MSTITFDTLKFANTLKEAGVPDKQAEAEARAVADAFATNASELATKGDIARLEAASKADIALLRSEMQAMEMRLTIKLGAFLAVAVGVMLTVLKMH